MSLMLHCDFRGVDWVGLQRASDPPQVMGASSVDIRDLQKTAGGVGASIANGPLFDRYTLDRAKYGKAVLSFTTGATAGVEALIGYNGVSTFNTAALTGQYTAVVWVRRKSGINPLDTFRLRLVAGASTLVSESASVTVTTTWQKFTTTGVFSGATGHLRFTRTSGATDLNFEFTGAMIVAGATAPDTFNAGAASLLDDLTPYWMDGRWGSGFVKAHQAVAPLGKADLTLKNADKRFSPEYASGPLYGNLKPNLLVQIADPDVGIWWTGWTDKWMPEPGPSRTKRATLSATDARRFISGRMPRLPLYYLGGPSPFTHVVLDDTLEQFDVPNTTDGLPEINIPGTPAWPYYFAWPNTLTSGTQPTLVYADNTKYDQNAVDVLADILGSVQGKLWFTREGSYLYRAAQGDTTPATYNNVGALWMEAGYEISPVINLCEVIAHKRKLQTSGGPYTVWEQDENVTLEVGESEDFRIVFTHSNESKVLAGAGGTFAVTGTLLAGTFGTGGTNVVATLTDLSAQSALLTLTNTSAAQRVVTAVTVTATIRAVQVREVSREYEDTASITANGTLSERLNHNFISQNKWAKRLARYRVNRFKDPIYEVPWFTIHADKNPDEAFRCYVGAPIYFSDAQTDHAKYYACIGEQHTVKAGVTDHKVRVYLESLYDVYVADTPLT